MKKLSFLILILLLFSTNMLSCGGGGGTEIDLPGINTADEIKLRASSYIPQTNGFITLEAEVLYKGRFVEGVEVVFINLSPVGNFFSPVKKATTNPLAVATSAVNIAVTDSAGKARVGLRSTTSGFVTVQVEINGADQVRDQRTVFFTTSKTFAITLTLGVDGTDADSIFDETEDFLLFENAADDEVTVRATVLTGDVPISNSRVTFGADAPYRVGDPDAACSDGSDTCEVFFPNGNIRTTDSNGQAFVLVQVTPTFLRTITTTLNITAVADNGAFNMVTLFLSPVTIPAGGVVVSANPPIVASEGTSTITAFVTTSAGTPVPDGTSVNFTATAGGGIEPFAQTTDGIAEVEFTAPTVTADTTVTITATVAGVSGITTVMVTAEPLDLIIVPSTAGINGILGGTVTFTISGGTPTYTTTSSNPTIACNSTVSADLDCLDATDTGVWTGGTVIVTVPAGTAATSVTINVTDSVGGTASATLAITTGPPLSVLPTSGTVTGINNPVAVNCPPDANATDDLVLTISGGTPPYSAVSSDLVVIPVCALSLVGSTLTVDPDNVAATVTITISDSSSPVQSIAVIVTVQ